MGKLHRFEVESYVASDDDWEEHGSVLLPDHAGYGAVEHALAAVGVFAPRGADMLEWDCGTSYPYAQIMDQAGNLLVRITARSA